MSSVRRIKSGDTNVFDMKCDILTMLGIGVLMVLASLVFGTAVLSFEEALEIVVTTLLSGIKLLVVSTGILLWHIVLCHIINN